MGADDIQSTNAYYHYYTLLYTIVINMIGCNFTRKTSPVIHVAIL